MTFIAPITVLCVVVMLFASMFIDALRQ